MSRMPTTYREPMGLPLNWRDDVTGELPAAVMRYYGFKVGEAAEPDQKQIELIRDYLVYYIEAPCWLAKLVEGEPGELAALAELRKQAREISSAEDIHRFIWACLDVGMDPL